MENEKEEAYKMAIIISLESTVIPVQIGDLKFKIDVTDEKYEKIVERFNSFLVEIEALDEEKSEDIAKLKGIVEEMYEELLGEGAYEKIHAKMPNISFVTGVLANLVTQLIEEVDKRTLPTLKAKAVVRKQTKKQTKK